MLKPPVTITALMNEWDADCVIDDKNLFYELNRISLLHAKYSIIATHHKLILESLMVQLNQLKLQKLRYYSGDLNEPKFLAENNLEPFVKTVTRQADMFLYIDGDPEVGELHIKCVAHREISNFAAGCVKALGDRNYALRSNQSWLIHQQGGRV
jgi:hypothetical protein